MTKTVEKSNHGKKIIMHLKRHHKKYLFGAFGGFAIVKMVLLFFGLSPVLNVGNIFANGDEEIIEKPEKPIILNSGNFETICKKSQDLNDKYIFDCSNKGIINIEPGTFENIVGDISYLNFSDNYISSIGKGAFWGLTLGTLDLSHNKLSNVDFEIFDGAHIERLILDYNEIFRIYNNSTSNFYLSRLYITNNCLQDETIANLYEILNTSSVDINYENQQACLYVWYKPDEWTKDDVEANLTLTGHVNSNYSNYHQSQTFTGNGSGFFDVSDLEGDTGIINYPENGKFPAEVTWIDKEIPHCGSRSYSPNETTNHRINTSIIASMRGAYDDESGIITGWPTCTIDEDHPECKIIIRDLAGNENECISNRRYDYIDTIIPSVSVDTDNDILGNNYDITITANDDKAGLAIDQVIKYRWQDGEDCTSDDNYDIVALNPNTAGTMVSSGIINTTSLDEGTNYLCILPSSIYDRAGNTNTGLVMEFIIDNTAPNCSRGEPSSGSLQVDNTGYVILTCNDANGIGTDILNSTDVEYDEDIIRLSDAEINADEERKTVSYTFVYTAVGSGNTSLILDTGKVQDIAGNGNNLVPSTEISVSQNGNGHGSETDPIEIPGLVLFLEGPIGNWVDKQTIAFRRYSGAIGGYEIVQETGSIEWDVNAYSFSGEYSFDIDNQDYNEQYVCAFGWTGGYITKICSQRPIKVDHTDPIVQLLSPDNDEPFEFNSEVTLSWSGRDLHSGVSGYKLTIKKPSNATESFYYSSSITSTGYTVNQSGTWQRYVTVYDKTARESTETGHFIVHGQNNNTTGELVSITEPAGNGNWTDSETITINWNEGATGGYRCLTGSNLNLPRSGETYNTVSSGSITISINEGHFCNQKFICALGKTGDRITSVCTTKPVRVDTSDPYLTLISPRNEANLDYGNIITLSWSGYDGISGISGYILNITKPSGNISYSGDASFTGKDISLDKTGNRSRSVVAYDYTNRSITGSRAFTVTGDTPIYTGFYLIYPNLGTLINLGNDVTLEWHQGTINSGYSWSINSISGTTIASGSTSGSTVTVSSGHFTTGAYSWSVKDNYSDTIKSIRLFYVVDEADIPDLEVKEFEFDEIENADLDEYYSSDTITIKGLSDGWYTFAYLERGIGALYINKEFVGTSGFVKNGDKINIEMKASDEYDTTVKTTLFVGGGESTVSGDFKITTKDGINGWDNPSLTPMQRLWGIIYVDSLVEMYQYDEEKLAIFLSTFMQLLQDKSDYYADKILEAEENGDDELAQEYRLYKEAVDFLYVTVKYRYDNIEVQDRRIYIAPNGKQYLVEYDEDRMAYTSPDFARPKYFPTRELFTNHIDLNNPAVGKWGIVGNVITTHNGKVYTIYEKNGKWTSSNFKTAKYFDTKEDIINHILANNPASDWNHRIDTDFDEVKYTAPSGKVYRIFKTSSKGNNPDMYSSLDFVNAKYFTSLEAAKKFIDQNNPKK